MKICRMRFHCDVIKLQRGFHRDAFVLVFNIEQLGMFDYTFERFLERNSFEAINVPPSISTRLAPLCMQYFIESPLSHANNLPVFYEY